jgi:hypothetical protein
MTEGARKSGKFVAVCEDPDYCYTPRGGKKKLVPYMIASDLSKSVDCSADSFFTSEPVFLFKTSLAPRVEGNEAGVGDGKGSSGVDERGNGGLHSGINNGVVWADGHSATVFVNQVPVARHLDHVWMNHKPVGGGSRGG